VKLERELDLDQPFRDRRHATVLGVLRTAAQLSALGAPLFRRHGLTEAQFNVLFALKYRGRDLTQSDLSRRLVVSRASITSVLDRLEKKGLVRRVEVPENRRIYLVELTGRGLALVNEVEPAYREVVHAALADLPDRTCEQLNRLLERVREGVDEAMAGDEAE
jgi:MarR family 2-MHQ and catechol resistance regulon transcriptional repressor